MLSRFALLAFTLLVGAPTGAQPPAATEHFEKSVRPLFLARCVSCHGAEKQKGGLRLDTKAGWQAGGDTGPAVVPGKPAESLLLRAVRGTDGVQQMPPQEKLTEREIAARGSLPAWR